MTTVDADSAALAAAAVAAEEALCLQREALCVLGTGWGGESGSAAVDLVQHQCIEGSGVVAELHRVAGELALLADQAAEGSDPGIPAAAATLGNPFAAPAVPPPTPPPPPTTAAWPAGAPLPAVPDLGGSLVGLAAQIAELLGSGANLAAEEPFEEPVEEPAEEPAVEESADLTGEPAPPPPVQSPVEPPSAPVAVPATVPQQDSPASAAVGGPPTPDPEPLLAAEVPPPVIPDTDPVADPATPCEIAADELPQVGG